MRPQRLDEIIGQQHILAPSALLYRMIQADMLSSIILFGPPGTGKTTIANVIANTTDMAFEKINATTAGKTDMKKIVELAIKRQETDNKGTILFIDEIHRFNKGQQDYLLPYVENGTIVLIGATTENPYFEVNGALLSRSRIFELKPLSKQDVITTINRALSNNTNGYGNYQINISDDVIEYLSNLADGDARHALNTLELAVETTNPDKSNTIVITKEVIENCTQKRIMRFDKQGENHYDFISAFIESMKHSDPDAALYYLARMIESGEDPKYIARRLIVNAANDIGLANPQALNIAVSTFLTVERVGLPECIGALAMSTIYNATSLKSNTAINGYQSAKNTVSETRNIPIPDYLKDESYKSAWKLGRGNVTDVFTYPYNYTGENLLPPELQDKKYYIPAELGYENNIKKYMDWCEEYKNAIKNKNTSQQDYT